MIATKITSIVFGCLLSLVWGYDLCQEVETHTSLKLLPENDACSTGTVFMKKIQGGQNVLLREFPWIVQILKIESIIPLRLNHWCGGSIINEKYILTAAHCFDKGSEDKIMRVGEYDLDTYIDCDHHSQCAPTPKNFYIEKLIIHESYNDKQGKADDIALVRVKGEISFNEYVKPVCLPTFCRLIREQLLGEFVVSAGWGNLVDILHEPATVLQKVEFPVTSIDHCMESWNTRYSRTNVTVGKNICIGGSHSYMAGKNVCWGDSGGPLMYKTSRAKNDLDPRYYLVGVISFGDHCKPSARHMSPAGSMNVTHYLPWLLDNIHA